MIRGKTPTTWLGVLLLGIFVNVVAADAPIPQRAIDLGAPFCDNAVLQREMPVPVWGWSEPGTMVTVEFAGQAKTAKAGQDGKWMLELDKLKASFEPREMSVQVSGFSVQGGAGPETRNPKPETIILKNILVGEVWMASGQSNMQWKVAKSSSNKLIVEARDGVAPIREFEVTSVYAMLHPIEKATGAWKDGDYSDYSAIAFAFAHKLYEELNVPIGILNCSFSQTAIQAWVPRVGFRDGQDDYTMAIYQKILETDPATPEHQAAWNTFYQDIDETLEENAERVKRGESAQEIVTKTPGNMSGNRDATWLFNGRLNPVIPYAIRGGIWNQGYANMGEGMPYYQNLHSLIRGWRLCWERPELPVYFHQFYTPGKMDGGDNAPSIGSTAEMRLGTWLARDIPNAGMASQIDIAGAIHYNSKAVPGQRLALHALKNQYPSTTLRAGGKAADLVADGPMFKSYTVKGSQLMVEFEHAEGGLLVAETGSNATGKEGTGFANPKIIENGEDQVTLFYLAGEDRVWHPARVKLDGSRAVVSSPAVKQPRGVSYATGGVGFQPNLYNQALLPMTPFIYFDNALVTSESWPEEKLKVAGEEIDPSTVGRLNEWRKMPLLSTQFRDHAVFQAGKPVTVWGSVQMYGESGGPAEGEAVVSFSFAGTEKTIPVTPGMEEWQVTLPPMEASAVPKTLKVTFTIDGELAHERVCTNIVVGDVWYVAAPTVKLTLPKVNPSGRIVRMIENQSKRSSSPRPSRYSVAVSRTPDNRFASSWEDASGLAGALGHTIAAKTGKPVGVIFMESKVPKAGTNPELKSWIPPEFLNQAPSLMEDYKQLAALRPGNAFYDANAQRYIAAWKQYWGEYIPHMIATRAVPDGAKWGSYPTFASAVTTEASETYNVEVHSFTPAALKGILFLSSDAMVAADAGANFGPELSALANGLKAKFGGEDIPFIYTLPGKTLAPKITAPAAIQGKSKGVELGDWSEIAKVIDAVVAEAY